MRGHRVGLSHSAIESVLTAIEYHGMHTQVNVKWSDYWRNINGSVAVDMLLRGPR